MRLLIADDHALFRDVLLQYIERAEPETKVLLAKDLHEVIEIMEGEEEGEDVDLILLDLHMPGMNGLNGLQRVREAYPEVPVALLSGVAEKEDVEQALALGAVGYLPKTMPGKSLLKGINQIISGESFVARDHNSNEIMPSYYGDSEPYSKSRPFYAGLSEIDQDALDAAAGSLTPREREVLGFLVGGASNKEIANALGLQVVTVKLHIRGVCRKLNARNRTQAALMAQKLGMTAAASSAAG